jgi:hypothetical protein
LRYLSSVTELIVLGGQLQGLEIKQLFSPTKTEEVGEEEAGDVG